MNPTKAELFAMIANHGQKIANAASSAMVSTPPNWTPDDVAKSICECAKRICELAETVPQTKE